MPLQSILNQLCMTDPMTRLSRALHAMASGVILRNANGGWTRFGSSQAQPTLPPASLTSMGCALDYLSLKRSVDYVHTYVGTRRQSCAVLYLVHDAQEVHVRGNDLLN